MNSPEEEKEVGELPVMSSSLKLRAALPFLLLLVLPALSSAAVSSSLQAACDQTVYPDKCVAAIQGDPRSATADLPGLAVVARDIAEAKASVFVGKLQGAEAGASDPGRNNSLQASVVLYNYSVDLLRSARVFLAEKQYDAALAMHEVPFWVPSECKGLVGEDFDADSDSIGDIFLFSRRFAEILSSKN